MIAFFTSIYSLQVITIDDSLHINFIKTQPNYAWEKCVQHSRKMSATFSTLTGHQSITSKFPLQRRNRLKLKLRTIHKIDRLAHAVNLLSIVITELSNTHIELNINHLKLTRMHHFASHFSKFSGMTGCLLSEQTKQR